MYKDYTTEDYIRCTEECSAKVKELLMKRYDELEWWREAINDRYPFEDLYLKQHEVDDEEEMILDLIKRLEIHTGEMIDRRRQRCPFPDTAAHD